MHFIDRNKFTEAPIAKLEEFNNKYKQAWIDYNLARINKIKPLPTRPPSRWTDETIRKPLEKLFLKNCGYCGIHTTIGSDAEVDHYHPTIKDQLADYVFEWTNYIWSCHSCNNQKKDNFPFLDPCSEEDMKYLYFHTNDGRYLLFPKAPDDIISKYNLTDEKSNLNGKNRPDKRICLYKNIQKILDSIKLFQKLYKLECSINGKNAEESIKKQQSLESKKKDLLEWIKSGDSLFLIKFQIDKYNNEHEYFPYSFTELLEESKYLDI